MNDCDNPIIYEYRDEANITAKINARKSSEKYGVLLKILF